MSDNPFDDAVKRAEANANAQIEQQRAMKAAREQMKTNLTTLLDEVFSSVEHFGRDPGRAELTQVPSQNAETMWRFTYTKRGPVFSSEVVAQVKHYLGLGTGPVLMDSATQNPAFVVQGRKELQFVQPSRMTCTIRRQPSGQQTGQTLLSFNLDARSGEVTFDVSQTRMQVAGSIQ